VSEFHHYTEINRAFVPNYGAWYRHGEAISTAFVESTVNQVISKQAELSAVLADAPLDAYSQRFVGDDSKRGPPRPGRAGLSEG